MVEREKKYLYFLLGGGTFWGLGKLLTSAKGFDELLQLAENGDHRKVRIFKIHRVVRFSGKVFLFYRWIC